MILDTELLYSVMLYTEPLLRESFVHVPLLRVLLLDVSVVLLVKKVSEPGSDCNLHPGKMFLSDCL